MFLVSAEAAGAQTQTPSFKNTAPYKALKNYVDLLQQRSATPATAEQKQNFRSQLITRRNAANAKVKSLFTLTINQIKRQDDVQERAQVKQILQNQKAQVQALNNSLAAQLKSIDANESVALDKINSRFARRLDPLVSERTMLRVQIATTTNPVKRANLTRRLTVLQNEINAVMASKQATLNAAVARFNSRISAAKTLTATRIKNVKAAAKRQILQARRAWMKLFREEFAEAKEERSDNFELVTDLHQAGLGYIQQMPLPQA